MKELDLHDMWFQQDGTKCHTTHVTMHLLRDEFGEHPVNWPPRSCDLTTLGYRLWGHVEAHVYTEKPASMNALEDNIEAFIREIILERVC